MKKNNFSKKPKMGWSVLMIILCGLFVNTAMGQITYTWNGSVSTSWTDPANWTPSAGTSYPGTVATDIVVIDNNSTLFAPIFTGTETIASLTVSNAFGTAAGATLTIASGTLNVSNSTINVVTLAGGNIVNSGILNITSTSTGASQGILLASAVQVPSSPIEFGYSGLGTLSVNIANAAANNAAAISVNANSANTTYKMLLNSATTTITLSSGTSTSFAIRAAGGAAASPLIIGGTGFTLGSTASKVRGGLLAMLGQSKVTVNSGTTLEMNSLTGNTSNGLQLQNNTIGFPTIFTNNGTINIFGETTRNGINVKIDAATTADNVSIIILNDGVINVDIVATTVSVATTLAFSAYNASAGSTTSSTTGVTFTNNGILSLKNSSNGSGLGYAIWGSSAGQRTRTTFTNNGTLNISGTINNVGQGFTLTNNAIINSNSGFNSFSSINNSSNGSINFIKAVTIPATFTVDISAAATLGSIYTDTNLTSYTVSSTKVAGTGTSLATSFDPIITVSPSGTLTLVSGTGDATIAYSAVAITTSPNAIIASTTNSGIINTGKGGVRNLSIISGVSDASTGTIAPGGSEYGIAELNKVNSTPDGILKIQVAGNLAAGFDYDQLTNSFVGNTLTLTNLDLNISYLYTPASNISIPIVTVSGAGSKIAAGSFASVTGLKAGWTLDYSSPTVVNLVYTSGTTTPNTWTGTNSTVWTDAGNWSNGVPTVSSDVTITTAANQPEIGSDVDINSLTINTNASLIVNSGFKLSVTDIITNNGSLTIANNANLIQVNNVSNTGNITVNRNSNPLSRFDYTIWSSPVASQDLLAFSPATLTNRFYNYNEVTNQYNLVPSPSGTPFAVGSGYLIRMPDTAVAAPATQTFAGSFTGVPNNGTVTVAMTYNGSAPFGYNMVGNPYPSTIDAQAFITANTVNIESSLYFWRKINAASGSAYAVYNPLGSTTATPSSALPNGTIQVGQGFFVKAKTASNLTFTNAMRVANNGNQFFKTKQVQKDRLWLNLSRPAIKTESIDIPAAFSQALIGYTADATLDVDIYDAKYINDSKVALTSSINNEEYTIQGRPVFDPSDKVALNFKSEVAADYTIALDHFDGLFATGQDVYLLDSKTGAETNLKSGNYTFTAGAGEDNSRFSLKYQKTLKVDAPAFNDNSVSVYKNNGSLYVNSGSIAINSIKVYDVQGRLLISQRNVKDTTATISNLRAINQVLIVKISGENGSVVSKKVIN